MIKLPFRLRPFLEAARYRATFCALALILACCSPPKLPPRVSESPRRIISVVPSVTETLFALGVGGNVVAVGNYDHFPPEVEHKPRIGGLINPNVEKIIELHPDLVISYGSQDVLSERLQSLGVQVFPFRHGNVEQTLRFILDLGRRVGTEDRAEQLVAGIRHSFDEVRAVATTNRPKVFLVHDRAGGTLGSFYTIGSRAFQHDLIEIAGGRLQAAHCVRKDLEHEFWSYCHTDEHSDRVGELAFGTNIALDDMIGVLLQDEKVPGVHLAFGDPYGSQTGAAWKSCTHIDVLTRACNVWIDDEQVIGSGRYLLDRLGLR